jgi:quinol monooxygenase YgiN
MLQFQDLDPEVSLYSQFANTLDEAVILVNVFHVDLADQEDFKLAWQQDATFFCAQPGCLSAQLHQGIEGSHMFLNYAVFENAAAFAATTKQPQFGPLREIYPDSAIAHPHLFRRIAVPGICVGEVKKHGGTREKEPKIGLRHEELDPEVSLYSQFANTLDEAVILVNMFHVDLADQEDFKLAWQQDATFFCAQPGCLSAQLHQGIEGSHMFLNYAVFENAAAFAATTQQPQFKPLRMIYPDSAIAHPHLFRRLAIPGICVGEMN